jgi:hypothetical protein
VVLPFELHATPLVLPLGMDASPAHSCEAGAQLASWSVLLWNNQRFVSWRVPELLSLQVFHHKSMGLLGFEVFWQM